MRRRFALLVAILLLAPAAGAEVTLPSVFGDHMVLQRDRAVSVWGKAKPGEDVTVRLSRVDADAPVYQVASTADAAGDWQVELTKNRAEGVFALAVWGASDVSRKTVFNDVVFGEVWVASGQSNMEWTVANSADAAGEIANSANDQIRMWTAARTVKTAPASDVPGRWAVASPQTTGRFSAVAYYFARRLQRELGVPVGVLHSSWGGTPVEAWTSREKLDTVDWAGPILQRYDAAVKVYPKAKRDYDQALLRWRQTRNGPENTGEQAGYARSDFDDADWGTMRLPRAWEQAGLGNKDGVVWFRTTIQVPEGWAGRALKLNLGPIDDGDTTYVNGTKVGATPPSARGAWRIDRRYDVPGKVVTPGKLTVSVRVVDLSGAGGVWGQPEQLSIVPADGQGEAVSLAGDWKYLLAHELDAQNRPTRRPGTLFGPEHPHSPAGLYNGMIAPIVPYTIRGAIWYQGESNASRAEQYGKLFPAMIEDWRERWGQGDFPFLFVQLANYLSPTDQVVDTEWAHLRDAQLKTLGEVNNTGMAVAIDIGEANDIHPRNKQDVGKRLARWALVDTYGTLDRVKSGPIYKPKSLSIDDGKASVGFDAFGSKLMAKGEAQPNAQTPLFGFTIAGNDGKFHVAQALIADAAGTVTVWSDRVPEPVAVRYAWEDNPTEANLVNGEGLPASPFRTDRFEGPTDGRR